MKEPEYLSCQQAADMLGLSRHTIRLHILSGNLPERRIGNQFALTRDEIEDYAEARKTYQGMGRPPKKRGGRDPRKQ